MTPKILGMPEDIASIPKSKSMGYAFDDGPNCAQNIFYNYLTSQNQKPTMFYALLTSCLRPSALLLVAIRARECFSFCPTERGANTRFSPVLSQPRLSLAVADVLYLIRPWRRTIPSIPA